jgi:hypothetical protein
VSHTEVAHLATAPVRAICLASVTVQRTVFNGIRRNGEPLLVNEHFDGSGSVNPIRCWPTVLIVAATLSGLICQLRIDVMGVSYSR